MMTGVAHTVMTNSLWGTLAVLLMALFCVVSLHQTYRQILGGGLASFGERLRRRAALCLDKSGFIGAVLARHTVLVTLNILAFNLSLALLSTIRALGGPMSSPVLQYSLVALAAICVCVVLIIAVTTFALCNEVVRQAERSS